MGLGSERRILTLPPNWAGGADVGEARIRLVAKSGAALTSNQV